MSEIRCCRQCMSSKWVTAVTMETSHERESILSRRPPVRSRLPYAQQNQESRSAALKSRGHR